jgi:osmotically-inducible protein OsmY
LLFTIRFHKSKPFDMADYNRNRRNQDWGRDNRNREYDEFGSFDRTNYNREDWDRYRRQNIAGYDPYTGHDYGRQDQYGNYSDYNDRERSRDLRTSYGDTSYGGGWDRRDNRYGSYNAGYSDQGQRRDRRYDEGYGGSYGASDNYGQSGYTSRNLYREEDYRRGSADRDRGGNRGDRTFWERAADEVSSWFGADDRDRRHREDQRSGLHKGKGPRGYSRSDERIREDISDRLSDDPYVDASDIEVKVSNGEVVLEGHTENKQAKRRAEDIAEAVAGVKNVENHLKVSHSTATVGSSRVYSDRQEDKDRDRKRGWF